MKRPRPIPGTSSRSAILPGRRCRVGAHLTNYGAFVEIEQASTGLLHVGDMTGRGKITHPSEMVTRGPSDLRRPECRPATQADRAWGLKPALPAIRGKRCPGRIRSARSSQGKVTKADQLRIFVELEPGLEGLVHISELASTSRQPGGGRPGGGRIEVKLLRVDKAGGRIGLTRKGLTGEAAEMALPLPTS